MRLHTLHPFLKIAVWLGIVGGLAMIVQSIAWLGGWDFNILSNGNGARGILLFLTVISLIALISLDRRPISDYGLFVGPSWKKFFFGGLAIGAACFASYMCLAILLGTYQLTPENFSGSRLATAISRTPTGIPLALAQQFVFSGYLLTMLRDRLPRGVAVGIAAALFAVLGRLSEIESFWEWSNLSLLIGLFLVGAVLGALRVKTGNIVLPAGVLAGWLALSRFTTKLQIVAPVAEADYLQWVAPFGDPRRGPLLWCLLAVALTGVWQWLRRSGEDEAPLDAPAIDADFKRIFPFSHGNALTPLDVWVKALRGARFRIEAAYVPRLIAVFVMSTVNTVLSLPERILAPLLVRRKQVRQPVFILGVHRSGTTHLHNLMSLDPQFCSPRSYQVMNPAGFLTSGWLIMPILGAFMSKRPMDNVRFHMFTPGEEEFAICGLSTQSPYWGLTFPQDWPQHEQFIFPDKLEPKARQAWISRFQFLMKKMTLFSRRRPLLKNPYNTGRLAILKEMYPDAKFIHISRHPHDAYRSNAHMSREGHVLNQLQDPPEHDNYETRFVENYHAMESAYLEGARQLAADESVELRFEDLERDPIYELRRIYDQLNLEWTSAFESKLRTYLDSLSDYQKNKHRRLPADQADGINSAMVEFMQRWNYAEDGSTVFEAANHRDAA